MLRNRRRNFQITQFLFRNLSRVRARQEMNFVRRAIDLLKQSLQIDRAAGAGGSDYQFHFSSVIPSGAKRSRGIPRSNRTVALRDSSISLGRTKPAELRRVTFHIRFIWKSRDHLVCVPENGKSATADSFLQRTKRVALR